MDIKARIKESGWTLVDLASAMDTTQSCLSHLLKDGANPSIKKLQQIASIIGVSLSELVADTALPSGEFMAMVNDCGQLYCCHSLPELDTLVANLKAGKEDKCE